MEKDYKTLIEKKLRQMRRECVRSIKLVYAKTVIWQREEKPDFIGIGAPRAASTWLHKRLSLHPHVYLAELKEVHFFDEYRSSNYVDTSGISWYRPFYFDMNNESHWRWYYMQFVKGKGRIKGEITPDYSILSEKRVKLIAERFPNLKIIYIIRNPIDRAWSNIRRIYWHQLGMKKLEAISGESLLVSAMHPEVLIRGNYKYILETWQKYFNDNQILYLFFDDIKKDPRGQLLKICKFLKIDPYLLPPEKTDAKKVNKAPESTMPEEIKNKLLTYYQSNLDYLQSRFPERDFTGWRKSQ